MFNKDVFNCISCSSRSKSVFSDFSDDMLNEICDFKTVNHFKKKQIILNEGQEVHGVYCIFSGKVKLSKVLFDNKEFILKLLNSGDIFGYNLFIANKTHSNVVEVIEDANICFLNGDRFLELLKKYPPFSLKLLSLMSSEIMNAEEISAGLAYKSTNERFVEVLLNLNDLYGVIDEEYCEIKNKCYKIDIPLSRHELASLIGTSVENFVRILSFYKEKDIIRTKGRQIYITNLPELKAMKADFSFT